MHPTYSTLLRRLAVPCSAVLGGSLALGACSHAGTPAPGVTAATSVTSSRIVTPDARARIDSTLRSFVQAGSVAGVSALIHEKGGEVYFNAFGMADRESRRPMARDAIVQIFSMTKRGELDGARVLRPETVRLMATSHLSDDVTERSWLPSKGQVGFGIAFAVRVRPPASASENNGVVGEFFWDGAASTLFWVDPANQLAAVLFVQLLPFDRIKLHKGFRDAVYGPIGPSQTATP